MYNYLYNILAGDEHFTPLHPFSEPLYALYGCITY